jgi:hypothetical protein
MREASMKAIVISALLILAWTGAFAQIPEPVFEELPGPGKICRIGDVYTFTYEFDKTPKMGMAILKVRLFDETGKRTTGLEITGRSDMPSMSGAHDSGEVQFKLNRKGDYLLPVNIVMPGEWQIRLVFSSNKEVIFRGSFKFDV